MGRILYDAFSFLHRGREINKTFFADIYDTSLPELCFHLNNKNSVRPCVSNILIQMHGFFLDLYLKKSYIYKPRHETPTMWYMAHETYALKPAPLCLYFSNMFHNDQ